MFLVPRFGNDGNDKALKLNKPKRKSEDVVDHSSRDTMFERIQRRKKQNKGTIEDRQSIDRSKSVSVPSSSPKLESQPQEVAVVTCDGDAHELGEKQSSMKRYESKAGKKRDSKKKSSSLKQSMDDVVERTFELIRKEESGYDGVTKVIPYWMKKCVVFEANQHATPLSSLAFLLEPFIVTNLQGMGVSGLFPLQMAVIPAILQSSVHELSVGESRPSSLRGMSLGATPPSDLCVAAPTGSGKTLTYVIPIVQVLSRRVIRRLRALIILPSRDLAIQVKSVFDIVAGGTDLRIAIVLGQSSFASEQSLLVKRNASSYFSEATEATYESCVDILIATPGRLLEHLRETPGFVLSHVRYLVVDEADRLLAQSYHGWLQLVLSATNGSLDIGKSYGSKCASSKAMSSSRHCWTGLTSTDICSAVTTDEAYIQRLHTCATPGGVIAACLCYTPLQKLLFSATITRNPEKLSYLDLRSPRYFAASADWKVKVPTSLREYMILTSMDEKPLVVLYLLQYLQYAPTLVFVSTTDAAHRLYLLLHFAMGGAARPDSSRGHGSIRIAEYSSQLSQKKRSSLVEDLRGGLISAVVCSDAMARGMDIEGVSAIINYDVPQLKGYIHRVGRTARAGKEGKAFTLVTRSKLQSFRAMLRKADNNYVRPFIVTRGGLEEHAQRYRRALSELKIHTEAEKGNTDVLKGNIKNSDEEKSICKEMLISDMECNYGGVGRMTALLRDGKKSATATVKNTSSSDGESTSDSESTSEDDD